MTFSDWRTTTLGEVIELKRGYDLPRRERKPGRVPIVSSSGISGFHSEAKVHGPGVITGRYGTIGNVYYIEEDFWPLNTSLYVRDFKGNDERFIGYFLRTINWAAFSDKAAVPGINRNHVHKAEVTLPPLVEQRSIAKFLRALDDKIELNQRMNATLEAIARAIFKSWFVDFDPVRAKMDGRDNGLPSEIAAMFPIGFDGSELGKIPSDWRIVPTTEILDILSGGTPTTSMPEYWNGDIEWVSAKDVSNHLFRFVLNTERKITKEGLNHSSAKILPPKTTIITARGTVGNICLLGKHMAMNQTNYGLRAKHGIGNYYVFFVIANLIGALQQASYGTIFDTITTRTLQNSLILHPSIEIISAFEKVVSSFMDGILQNQMESQILSELRDSLLPKFMKGEIRLVDN
jgi:type I restriction enzyme S subunit